MKASNYYQTETPFAIIETEENDFRIVIGDQLATRKCFKSKEDAETFLKETDWDIILTLIGIMTENITERIFNTTKGETNMQKSNR